MLSPLINVASKPFPRIGNALKKLKFPRFAINTNNMLNIIIGINIKLARIIAVIPNLQHIIVPNINKIIKYIIGVLVKNIIFIPGGMGKNSKTDKYVNTDVEWFREIGIDIENVDILM